MWQVGAVQALVEVQRLQNIPGFKQLLQITFIRALLQSIFPSEQQPLHGRPTTMFSQMFMIRTLLCAKIQAVGQRQAWPRTMCVSMHPSNADVP